jgi:DNA-binding IclR family transcriptional regulator
VQGGRSGLYALGPAAVALGVSAMKTNDFVNRSADSLEQIVAETGVTALLSVWGEGGPTVVRWQRSESFISTTLGLGTTLPLLNSATGRIFLAFLSEAMTTARVGNEVERAIRAGVAWPDLELTSVGIERLIARTRVARLASVDGRFIPGLYALAAPVLDWQGEAAAVVTLVGTEPAIADPVGRIAVLLDAHCRRLSIEPAAVAGLANGRFASGKAGNGHP